MHDGFYGPCKATFYDLITKDTFSNRRSLKRLSEKRDLADTNRLKSTIDSNVTCGRRDFTTVLKVLECSYSPFGIDFTCTDTKLQVDFFH